MFAIACVCAGGRAHTVTCLFPGLTLGLALPGFRTPFQVPGWRRSQPVHTRPSHLATLVPGGRVHPLEAHRSGLPLPASASAPGAFPANLGGNPGGGFHKLTGCRTCIFSQGRKGLRRTRASFHRWTGSGRDPFGCLRFGECGDTADGTKIIMVRLRSHGAWRVWHCTCQPRPGALDTTTSAKPRNIPAKEGPSSLL